MSIHIGAKKEEIAKIVLMPGDPLRAKYIAENFLEDAKLVTEVRGMLGYTGKYNGKKITVMGSGMGIPSMGIYSYELYNFYDVDTIIRIGSMGSISKKLELRDTVLVMGSYTESNFAKHLTGRANYFSYPDNYINERIEDTAKDMEITLKKANIACSECFDIYTKDPKLYFDRIPKTIGILGCEMESFALFETAKFLGKKAATLLTVSDANYTDEILTKEERENGMNNMIKLALETACKL